MGSNPIRHPVQVAEWSNAEDCKSSIIVGSNPTLNSNGESSKGRTPRFDRVYLGSTPSSPASPCIPIGRGATLRTLLCGGSSPLTDTMSGCSNGMMQVSKTLRWGFKSLTLRHKCPCTPIGREGGLRIHKV